ncbi:MAG: hypothetical protein ACRECX_13785 [Methyloceanibacter sp.]|uniref:hypothetical protein n=1 Tax=Methyloceanibacter sp. TaxID=1965321 RepID=UPI003D6D058B
MNKLLTTTAVALLLSVGPALAAEDAYESDQSGTLPEASQSDDSSLLPSDPEMKSEDEESEAGQPQAAMEADEDGQPPTTSNVTPDAAKEAKVPDDGSADESGGAKERSSAPPESGAVIGTDSGAGASDIPADEESSGASAGEQPQPDSETSQE